jgi:hypothetical protein
MALTLGQQPLTPTAGMQRRSVVQYEETAVKVQS